jgi:non-specific serine/threonine protein kinase
LEASLALGRELADTAGVGQSLNSLGFAALSDGDYQRATSFLEESLARGRETADETACYVALFNLARVAQALGDYDRAVALHEESLVLKRQQGDGWSIALSLSNLGHLARVGRRPSQAAAMFQESLALRRELGDRAGIVLSLIGLAGVAAALGEAVRAAWLLGAAEAQRSAIGFRLPAPDVLERDRILDQVRPALGEPEFTKVWTAGGSKTLDDAVTLALEAGEPPTPATTVPPRSSGPTYPDALSTREIEVLQRLVAGRTNKEIAAELVLSVRTVEHHRGSIYGKTGASSRAQLVAYAQDHGLAPPRLPS